MYIYIPQIWKNPVDKTYALTLETTLIIHNMNENMKKSKKYYAKFVPMLAIHVDNHFSDKFVLLCHVGDFVNGDWQKLMVGYICRTFYTFRDYILYFHLSEAHLSANYTLRDKNDYLPSLLFSFLSLSSTHTSHFLSHRLRIVIQIINWYACKGNSHGWIEL